MKINLLNKEKSYILKLFNGFTIVIALFFIILIVYLNFVYGINWPAIFTVCTGVLLLLFSLILSSYKRYNLSKYFTILVPPYIFMIGAILVQSDELYGNYFTYLTPRVFAILYLMVPVIFFSLERKKHLIISIILLSPTILLFDYFNNLAGVYLEDLKYNGEFYPIFIVLISTSYSFAIFGLLLAQRFNMSFRKRIDIQNNEILKEQQEVQILNDKLQFQSNLYSILEITSKDRNIVFILQDALDEILKLDSLKIVDKGLIFLKNENGELKIAANRNVDELIDLFSSIKSEECLCGKKIDDIQGYFCDTIEHKNSPIPSDQMIPNSHYVVPIKSKNSLLGIVNIYVEEGELRNPHIDTFLENVAIILGRKISEALNKEKLTLRNIEFKNQEDILKHTLTELNQSISYAQFLQKSLIPNQETMNRYFKESSFLFKPRDLVSGDFYFAHEVDDNLFFGVGDCTGHGIPGAFLAAMSIEAVKTVILTNKNKKPDTILNQLRNVAKDRFSVNIDDTRSDAMDAALCMYNKKDDILYYSGGFINLLIVRNNSEIIITPATKSPIGSYPVEYDFELHEIKLEKGDVIYLSSDGYVDQFGYDKNSTRKKPSKFKHKRFRELLISISALPSDDQVKILKKNIIEWRGDVEQTDDITVFIAKH